MESLLDLGQLLLNTLKAERVGVTKLRLMTSYQLRNMKGPIFVDAPNSDTPIAVLFRYDDYLKIQKMLVSNVRH